MQPITLHTLRHTFCTRLAAAGVDVRTIKELAGHADVQTTMRYLHLVESNKHQAIRRLSKYQEANMIQERIGEYAVNYEPLLEHATVTVPGFIVPEVVHSEDGLGAFEKCKQWAKLSDYRELAEVVPIKKAG